MNQILCDLCEKGQVEKSAILLSSDPLVILDICVICWLRAEHYKNIRVVENDEKVEEVFHTLDELE